MCGRSSFRSFQFAQRLSFLFSRCVPTTGSVYIYAFLSLVKSGKETLLQKKQPVDSNVVLGCSSTAPVPVGHSTVG
jgi:hypothetical protein